MNAKEKLIYIQLLNERIYAYTNEEIHDDEPFDPLKLGREIRDVAEKLVELEEA